MSKFTQDVYQHKDGGLFKFLCYDIVRSAIDGNINIDTLDVFFEEIATGLIYSLPLFHFWKVFKFYQKESL
jgi:hypothetical protein